MIAIRPVSDFRNKFSEVEKTVLQDGQPVFLTKNGYDTMALLSLAQYAALTGDVETKLDEADAVAEENESRLTHEAIFAKARDRFMKRYKLSCLPLCERYDCLIDF